MHAVEIISKKRDGLTLSSEEISWFVNGYTHGDIPDYQAAAFLMAVFIRGMSRDETAQLTLAMAHSGTMLDLSGVTDFVVDKHSSGGVGDKTSLVVLPLVASCGVPVAKMSGRGLGFSGGTLDKLESISGFRVNLTSEEFLRLARDNGLVLAGQSLDLAPADGKFYALRDVTGTVPSLPLIASSIMSKKIAAGAQGIVLDVKMGRGAFMATLDDARALANTMVDIGRDAGREVIAVISDMNQPLGQAVGNALEVTEAIETLKNGGPEDFRAHCLEMAGHMLRLAGRGKKWTHHEATLSMLAGQLANGEAFGQFRKLIAAQGGDVGMVDDPSKLPHARIQKTLSADRSGFIAQIAADNMGMASVELGGGRLKKGDAIDLAVGMIVHVNVGDGVEKGAPLVTVYANDAGKLALAWPRIEQAFSYSDSPVAPLPLFYDLIATMTE